MYQLNLPAYEIKLSGTPDKPLIFDNLRNKFVALTPEEWVRQHFVHYLTDVKGYPAALIANEITLHAGHKHLRADSVLYDKQLQPRMIMEYKAPTVDITSKTLQQISVYNLLLKVDYLILSNGIKHYCCQMDYSKQSYRFLDDIPDYDLVARKT